MIWAVALALGTVIAAVPTSPCRAICCAADRPGSARQRHQSAAVQQWPSGQQRPAGYCSGRNNPRERGEPVTTSPRPHRHRHQFALLCYSLVLGVRLIKLAGSDDVSRLRAAEPPATESDKPALEETA